MEERRLEYLKINPDDMTAVALVPLSAGKKCVIDGREITLREDIMQGHKFALTDIKAGEKVIKYGSPIGIAKEDIKEGQWIHTHNLKTGLGDLLEYTYHKVPTDIEPTKDVKFMGYQRANGKVGVRNEIWIIPTVGCVNNVAQAIERQAQQYVSGSVEAICAFPHPYGCSQMGDDQEYTRTILGDLILHPNAGGVLVLGLGCENSNIGVMKDYIGDYDDKRIRFLSAQDTEDEIASALEIIKELADIAKEDKREPISASELIIGLKCGGSDGLSGITANPTVGKFSDIIVSKGGTTMLTEVPEMFGAETLLMNRCANEEIFHETVDLINDFKNYFKSHNQTIYENPSPGNKKGGISTLEDKSLGCVQKSGSAAVQGVLSYGEVVRKKGLNLLSAPGNDLVAATALAASGAQIVLFTTGRGTPFASPVPTIKIATNTPMAEKKKNWIDFSCGRIVQDETIDETADKLFDYVIKVASGEPVKSEQNGFHDMAIFKRGVTL
ncbi:UxaA family hydrolase [Blautia liquoris]|uniref:UxaA family hydrolase n=1 Tax=Blautia liquoris TaxID=2779518 RepID=UPI001E28CD60|nr:altronate dehydratase family protein [Blautia liquoris]